MGIQQLANGKHRASVQVNKERHFSTHDTRTEAKRWIAEVVAANGHVPDRRAGTQSLRHFMRDWVASKPNIADSTREQYEIHLRLRINPSPLGRRSIASIKHDDVREWVQWAEQNHSTRAVASAFGLMSSALRHAVAIDAIRRNPADTVQVKSYCPPDKEFFEPHELDSVLERIEEQRDRDVVLGLALIGCRFGDLADLRKKNIDQINRRLWVEDQKTGRDRFIPISPTLREVLDRRVAEGTHFLFSSARGEQLNIANFRARTFTPAVAHLAPKHLTLHSLRHTCASWLIKSGHNPVQVATYLGHKNPTYTLNVYAHLFDTDLDDMAGSLERLWDTRGDVTQLRKAQ